MICEKVSYKTMCFSDCKIWWDTVKCGKINDVHNGACGDGLPFVPTQTGRSDRGESGNVGAGTVQRRNKGNV